MTYPAPQRNSESVDAVLTARNITLGDVRRVIPAHLLEPDERRSWFALLRVLGSGAACLGLLAMIGTPTTVLGWLGLVAVWLAYGYVIVGLFVIGHDCGHRSFSRFPWVNTFVGYLVMSPMANGYHTWKVTHDHHHAYTQLKGQEVDWSARLVTAEQLASMTWREHFLTRLGYALPFGLFLWISLNTLRRGVSVRKMIGAEKYRRERRRLLISNLIMMSTGGGLAFGLIYWFGIWGYIRFQGVPALIAAAIGAFIIAVGHANGDSLVFDDDDWSPARGQLSSTYNIRFARLLEYLMCDINIHIPHHVSTRIPWYNLRQAGTAIEAQFPELYQEHRFRFNDLAWCVRTPLLEKDAARGFYRLTSPSTAAKHQNDPGGTQLDPATLS